jgi:hypothetical protein
VSSYSLNTLVSTQAQLDNLADFLVQKYGDPEYRFESISINLDTVGATYKATLFSFGDG